MESKVCPVCEAPANAPCQMCAESYAMFLGLLIPQAPKKQEKPAEVAAVHEKINIGSGEDVCFS
jgi:hypothetical protein